MIELSSSNQSDTLPGFSPFFTRRIGSELRHPTMADDGTEGGFFLDHLAFNHENWWNFGIYIQKHTKKGMNSE